jgi:hypothetical protein
MPTQSEYVTAAEALELLEVSEGKLTAMLKSGELPWRPNPRNKRVKLIKRSDIEAWLANAPPPNKAVRWYKVSAPSHSPSSPRATSRWRAWCW